MKNAILKSTLVLYIHFIPLMLDEWIGICSHILMETSHYSHFKASDIFFGPCSSGQYIYWVLLAGDQGTVLGTELNPPPPGGSDPTPPRFFRNNFFIYYWLLYLHETWHTSPGINLASSRANKIKIDRNFFAIGRILWRHFPRFWADKR